MNRFFLILGFFIQSCLLTVAQSITITPLDLTKSYNGNPNTACVEFISKNPNLVIDENNGEAVQSPQKRPDGLYVYTCICDVTDTNKFGFNISAKGKVDKQILKVYIEDKQYFQYQIDVAGDISVKLLNDMLVIPVENTARAIITSNNDKLKIESLTKEKVEGPELTANNTFQYTVSFDVTTPESRDVDRSLTFSTGTSEDVKYDLGQLSPKKGLEISVIVLVTSCYDQIVNYAKNSFLNGNYKEAYETYRKALADNSCPDKPQDLTEDKAKMELYRKLTIAIQNADVLYKKAEQFGNTQQDSALYYQGEAKKFRNYIRKENPSDPYCLEYERYYNDFIQKMGRQISGRVVHNTMMDLQGHNLPIKDVYIILTEHKRETKNINDVQVPQAGKETGNPKVLGQTDANGNFTVYVPYNTKDTIYQLNFTADKEAMMNKTSYRFEYLPKDVDKETNLIVKLTPKNLN